MEELDCERPSKRPGRPRCQPHLAHTAAADQLFDFVRADLPARECKAWGGPRRRDDRRALEEALRIKLSLLFQEPVHLGRNLRLSASELDEPALTFARFKVQRTIEIRD